LKENQEKSMEAKEGVLQIEKSGEGM